MFRAVLYARSPATSAACIRSAAAIPATPRSNMDEKTRTALQAILSDIRAGMIANRYGASVFPPLRSAEKKLLELLFSKADVDAYYASSASEIYTPFP